MLKTIVVLPDGTVLSSGVGTVNAIQSVTITESVNDSYDLTLGSTCANMLDLKVIAPEGGLSVLAGDELTVYREDDTGTCHPVGIFTTEKPTRPSANAMSITAYDRVSWLDKDLTWWLAALDAWPYRLYDFAQMVCTACGLELANEEIPNGDYLVRQFSADGITGRQLIQWAGQIAGRFFRATPEGKGEFAWYEPVTSHNIGVTENAADPDAVTLFYYMNSLSFEDYAVAPIEKVQIRQNEEDVGTVYPDEPGEKNTYIITGNLLVTASFGEELVPVAQTLYEILQGVTYTPCKVSVPANFHIRAGHVVKITDRNGKEITAYVMSKTQAGQKDTLECTGSHTRESSTAVNDRIFKAFYGKVLNLRTDVDGLKVENRDAAGNMAALKLDLDGIASEVSKQQKQAEEISQQVTSVSQTTESVSIQVQDIIDNGVSKVKTGMGYTFDDEGLRIEKQGEEIQNLIDNRGVHVTRSGETMLQADADGVIATDVKVRNYLMVGKHARFEDYSNGLDRKRTACFWIEGE